MTPSCRQFLFDDTKLFHKKNKILKRCKQGKVCCEHWNLQTNEIMKKFKRVINDGKNFSKKEALKKKLSRIFM